MGIKGRGDKATDLDRVELALGAQRAKNRKFEAAMSQMVDAMTGPEIGAALPAQNFIIKSRGRRKGIIVTMVFYIDKNCTSVKCEILALKDNTGTDTTVIQSKVEECKWEDITDEERAAGVITREFKTALEFGTIYKVTRVVARNDDFTIKKVVLPKVSPYKVAPVVDFVNRYNQMRQDLGTDACFQTATSDDPTVVTDSCGGAEVGMVRPRPHPTQYVVPPQKINNRGVKPSFKVIVSTDVRRLRIVLIRTDEIGTGAGAYNKKISDSWDIDPMDFLPINDGVMAETNARYVVVQFGKPLDFGVEYQTVLIVVRGDNVGGPGIDILKNPVMGFAALDVGTSPATGTFIAGQLSDGVNSLLKEDTPFVSNTVVNNVPVDYVLKKAGVKAIMHMLAPSATTELRARITEVDPSGNDLPDKPTLADIWDDIQQTNDGGSGVTGQIKIRRRFGPRLDFNTTYRLKALAAFGTEVGGSGNDKALYRPDIAVAGNTVHVVTFTTPNEDGTFSTGGGNALQFVGITKRRYKKNGNAVFVTMKINAPKGTTRITAKICAVNDAGLAEAVMDYTFEDCQEEIFANGFIAREFGIKLDPVIAGVANSGVYGIVRLIAEGAGINSGFQGGSNPDVYRNPKVKPAVPYTFIDNGGTTQTFATANPISFAGATVPAQPLLTDLINTIENDEAKVSFAVIASSFRNTPNSGGTGTNGTVTFGDVGASEAFVIVNRAGQAGDNGTVDKQKFSVPVDPTATSVTIELEGLKTGKQYYIPRVGLQSGTDIAKTPAASPMTTILFRAGFEISFTGVTLSITTPPTAIDSRTSQVTVIVNNTTGSNVLQRNIQLYKSIPSKFSGFRLSGEYNLKDNSDAATPGTHSYDFPVSHPANSQIIYQAVLNPVKGGGPAITFTTGTLNTADDAPISDDGPPFYSLKQPKMRCRFKPTGFNISFRLPDMNMLTHLTNYVVLRFTTIEKAPGLNVFTRTSYLLDPKQQTVATIAFNAGLPNPVSSPDSFNEIGKGSDAFLPFDNCTVDSSSDGDFAGITAANGSALASEFRRINTLGKSDGGASQVYLQFSALVINSSVAPFTSPAGATVPYVIVTSGQIQFDDNSGTNRAFRGLAQNIGVSYTGN